MPIRPLSPALAEKAQLELNEDPKRLEEGIRHLKQWIQKQPHLRARTDDQWLAAFLRGCKFRLDQCKSKLDLYFTLRSTAPYLYSIKYCDSKLMDILNLGAIIILKRTQRPEDPRVVLYRIGQYSTKQYTILELMAVLSLQKQICFMEDDNLVVSGTINVVDFTGITLSHCTQTSLKELRNLISAHQEAVPIRIKSIHFINAPIFFGTFFSVVKRFMNEKSKSRIMFHDKNMESLYQHVSKDILPTEYGGHGDSVQQCIEYWKKKMRDYSSFYEDDLKYGTDESKRVDISRSSKIEGRSDGLEID